LWQGRYSWKSLAGPGLLLGFLWLVGMAIAVVRRAGISVWAIVFGVALLASLGLCLVFLYRWISVRYQLTSHRFVHESGILRRVTNRLEVIDIDDITYVQGPIERLFGVGTIRLTSSDRTHPELQLRGVAEVQRVASVFDDSRRRERRRRGLHIEAV
jgi:membrane protein YdbS with pleckstrin-like domain